METITKLSCEQFYENRIKFYMEIQKQLLDANKKLDNLTKDVDMIEFKLKIINKKLDNNK